MFSEVFSRTSYASLLFCVDPSEIRRGTSARSTRMAQRIDWRTLRHERWHGKRLHSTERWTPTVPVSSVHEPLHLWFIEFSSLDWWTSSYRILFRKWMQVDGWHRLSVALWSVKTFRRQWFQTDGKHLSFRASGSSLRTVGRGNIPNGGSLREDESSSSDPLSVRLGPQSNFCSEQCSRTVLFRFRHKNKAYVV